MLSCTLFLVVDDIHLDELSESFPTWLVCHDYVAKLPVLLVYDRDSVKPNDPRIARLESIRRDFGGKGSFKLVAWPDTDGDYVNHRVKMLTAYIKCSKYIDTEWFLKIDTDAIGTSKCSFIDTKWFESKPAFIAKPVKYSSAWLRTLENWSQTVPELQSYPKIDLANRRGKMCSWFMFCNVEWANFAASLLQGDLPVPSQDTYHSFIARKTGHHWIGVRFSKLGWNHKIIKSRERSPLLDQCPNILRKYGYEKYIN